MKTQYCVECGNKLMEVKTGYYKDSKPSFNKDTGKINTRLQCLNPKCGDGCNYLTGHKLRLFSNKCKLCGFVQCDC